jgi:hypothetical protein
MIINNKLAKTHWPQLDKAHLTLEDITPVIEHYRKHTGVHVEAIGRSYADRPIHRLSIGQGNIKILAWTQMHGDEATATAAVFDVIEHIVTESVFSFADFCSHFSMQIVPMLNPDGAAVRTRVNAQGIDINRDAVQMATPEGQLLRRLVDDFNPDIALNLHDQNPYYTAGETQHTSTIAFLAPAFDHEKTVNPTRKRAMQLIALMRDELEREIPGRIARYNDDYSYRSFGDTIAGLGASTILVESGAHRNDPHRAIARQMNVLSLITALKGLAAEKVTTFTVDDYFRIPENVEDGLTDTLLRNICLKQHIDGHEFHADVSIKGAKNDRRFDAIGHLSYLHGFAQLDAEHFNIYAGKAVHVTQPLLLSKTTYIDLLLQGFSHFVGNTHLIDNQSSWPILCVSQTEHVVQPGHQAFGLLLKGDRVQYALLDGDIFDLV